jgi:hypothetical protein
MDPCRLEDRVEQVLERRFVTRTQDSFDSVEAHLATFPVLDIGEPSVTTASTSPSPTATVDSE